MHASNLLLLLPGHCNRCLLLLDKGASIHQMDNSGLTALHLAAKNGHLNVLELLLQKGADPALQVN